MNRFILLITFFWCSLILAGQTGKVYDNLTMKSNILKMDRKYAVYLPPGYEDSKRSYPVLYLLHGSGDDQTGWIQYGEVQHIADEAINSGLATSMIIVMPDANTGRRGYVSDITGEWLYEDFFIKEFIPYVEKQYRIRAEKQYRAVSGNSMGGEGTFIYALHHPEMFSAACPLSPATGPLTSEDMKAYALKRGMKEGTADKQEAWFNRYSVLRLIENIPDAEKRAVRWYIDCGDDDFLFEGNSLVHIAMRKKEIPHEFRVRDGVHGWIYWRISLPSVLEFVSKGFHR
jgi:enterochelin esterase-like enzyme